MLGGCDEGRLCPEPIPRVSAAVADLEAAAASGQKLEYGWTSINFLLPAILLLSQAIFGLAAGMTVKCAQRAGLGLFQG